MRARQRPYAMVESHHEVSVRTAAFARLINNRADFREHVFDAVVELCIQCALMILCSFACADVTSDLGGPNDHTCGIAQGRKRERDVNQGS
jgi:hypothetical protein